MEKMKKLYAGYIPGMEFSKEIKNKVEGTYQTDLSLVQGASNDYNLELIRMGKFLLEKNESYVNLDSHFGKDPLNKDKRAPIFGKFNPRLDNHSDIPLLRTALLESVDYFLGEKTSQFYNNLFLKNGHASETLAELLKYEREATLGDYSKFDLTKNFYANTLDDYLNSKISSFSSDLASLVDNVYNFVSEFCGCKIPNSNGNKIKLRNFLKIDEKSKNPWLADYLEKTFFKDPMAKFVYSLSNEGKHGMFKHKLLDIPDKIVVNDDKNFAFTTRMGICFPGKGEEYFPLLPLLSDCHRHFSRGALDSVSEILGITNKKPYFNSEDLEEKLLSLKNALNNALF